MRDFKLQALASPLPHGGLAVPTSVREVTSTSAEAGRARRNDPSGTTAPRNAIPPSGNGGLVHKHGKATLPLISNAMLTTTGAALIAEGYSHFLPGAWKAVGRALTGYVQAATGGIGIGHYGHKSVKDPNLHNALGVLGSMLFLGEGISRMFEGEKAHLNRASAFGFLAAATKSANGGPLTTIPFAIDALCNGAEFVHGQSDPRNHLVKVAQQLTHAWKTADLAALQRGTGRVMILIAVVKTLLPGASQSVGAASRQDFERELGEAFDRVEGRKWEQALESSSRISSQAFCEKLDEFLGALDQQLPPESRRLGEAMSSSVQEGLVRRKRHPQAAGPKWDAALEKANQAASMAFDDGLDGLLGDQDPQSLSTASRLSEVLASSPTDAARLLKRFPQEAGRTLQELRRHEPDGFQALRTKYRVDTAFQSQEQEA